MINCCARCARPLKAGVAEGDPRRIYGPVGECAKCRDLPDVQVDGAQQAPTARIRKVSYCVL